MKTATNPVAKLFIDPPCLLGSPSTQEEIRDSHDTIDQIAAAAKEAAAFDYEMIIWFAYTTIDENGDKAIRMSAVNRCKGGTMAHVGMTMLGKTI